MTILETDWRWRLLLAREARTESARRQLADRARDGDLVRVVRGVYAARDEWDALDVDARFLTRVRAVAAIDPALIFSHAAAVAIWGLPWWGAWPPRVDVLAPPAVGSTSLLRRHAAPADGVVTIDGLRVTGLARTVVDVARGAGLLRGVVVADAALNPATRAALAAAVGEPDLEPEIVRIPLRHGSARARHVADFADPRSESPGESVSRVTMDRLGLASPVLQQEFPEAGSRRPRTDFWFPEFGVVGEFDGHAKYVDPCLLDGRSPAEAVYEEKQREDRIRRRPEVRGFARWGWADAASPPRLAAILRSAGVV